LVEMSVRWRKH